MWWQCSIQDQFATYNSWVPHMIVETLASACLLLEIHWQKGKHADKMCTCTHSLATFLTAPSNFLSLPSTEFLKNNFLWRLTIHPWLLASCWPWCGWSLTALRRVACKWRNLSVWRRRSIMFFSILQVDRLLHRSTHQINWNTIVPASSSATSLGSLAPNH